MSLKRIAALAGVSKSTVSRVINNDPHVSPRTRQKVQAIIDAEQFHVNPAARALASNKTQIIGVVITNDIGVLFDTSFYFPTILRGIAEATRARDYALLLIIGDKYEDDIRFTRRIVNNQIMDGVIIVSPTIGHPLIDELIKMDIPFVSADRIEHDHADINYITVENVESSRTAVNHMIRLGRRKIAIIVGDRRIIDSTDRLDGYRLALQDAGIPYDERLVIGNDFTYQSGYQAIQHLLEEGIEFDGVYASQSNLSVGALNALLDAGITIPDDVSLVAFDDLAESLNPTMGITTMRQDVLKKGYELTDTLIDLTLGKSDAPIQRFLPTELVIRETCGGLKK